MQNHNHPKKGGALPLLEFALGAALAGAAGYMYVTHKEEIDREAKKRIDQLAKLYKQSKPEIEKRVRKIWGDVSKNGIATYLNLRSMLLKELQSENLQKRGKMLQEQYEKIVDSVIATARKSGLLTPELEKKVADMFKLDWNDVQKMLSSMMMVGAEKAIDGLQKLKAANRAKKVRKHINKAAKKMSKNKSKSTSKKSGVAKKKKSK